MSEKRKGSPENEGALHTFSLHSPSFLFSSIKHSWALFRHFLSMLSAICFSFLNYPQDKQDVSSGSYPFGGAWLLFPFTLAERSPSYLSIKFFRVKIRPWLLLSIPYCKLYLAKKKKKTLHMCQLMVRAFQTEFGFCFRVPPRRWLFISFSLSSSIKWSLGWSPRDSRTGGDLALHVARLNLALSMSYGPQSLARSKPWQKRQE